MTDLKWTAAQRVGLTRSHIDDRPALAPPGIWSRAFYRLIPNLQRPAGTADWRLRATKGIRELGWTMG
ncbi:MAG TPA: hypothetical protein VIS76_14445, partial [Pseudomonadales bacterium]